MGCQGADRGAPMILRVEPGGEARTKKERRRGEVKARLRRSLHGLAADHSFVELRVSDITSSAGLSRSAFYFYYEDKRDLLIETFKEVAETLFDRSIVRFADEDDSRKLIPRGAEYERGDLVEECGPPQDDAGGIDL